MSGRSRAVRHRAEYLLARGMEKAVQGLSPRAADRLGEGLGSLLRSPLGIRRAVVEKNLRRAFPDAQADTLDRISRESYQHLGREVVNMIRLSQLDREQVRATVEVPDDLWASFASAMAEGRGAILATGHYGNWEMAAAAVASRGLPIRVVVQSQRNPWINARIEAARRSLGIGTIEMGDATRGIPRALAAGEAIGIAADQDARGRGVWVPFFGVPASSYRGPALFALRFGAPLFASVARRKPEGGYRMSGERIDVARTESLEEDVERLTAALARNLENEVRREPSQYFWLHKRWKTPPPEELVSALSGTRSHGAAGGNAP